MNHELHIATGIHWTQILDTGSYMSFGGLYKASIEPDLYVDISQTLARIAFMYRIGEHAGELLTHSHYYAMGLSSEGFKDRVVSSLPGEWAEFLETLCEGGL